MMEQHQDSQICFNKLLDKNEQQLQLKGEPIRPMNNPISTFDDDFIGQNREQEPDWAG
jgi:hypothetical protein